MARGACNSVVTHVPDSTQKRKASRSISVNGIVISDSEFKDTSLLSNASFKCAQRLPESFLTNIDPKKRFSSVSRYVITANKAVTKWWKASIQDSSDEDSSYEQDENGNFTDSDLLVEEVPWTTANENTLTNPN